MNLFRPQAVAAQDRLHGEVNLAPPLSWQLLGILFFCSVAAMVAFLSLASYGKVTVVSGRIMGDKGVVRAVPSRGGVVETILVREGQHVATGTPLARISLTTTEGGVSLADRRAQAFAERDRILGGNMVEAGSVAKARISALQAQIAGDAADIESVQTQIATEQDLIRNAQEDFDRAQTIAVKGFISGHDMMLRREKLDEHRQELSRLQQQISAKRTSIAAERAQIAQVQGDLAVQAGQIADQRAEIRGNSAEDQNARSLLVLAGATGVVTGIVAHPGDAVDGATPIMAVIPDGSRLQAEINVPSAAAGLLAADQPVRVAVDAYPYQTYGTVEARIRTISRATIPVKRADGSQDQAFIVEAPLSETSIMAYGARHDLLPGMSVTARITTRKRSLVSWLFDPILAVSRR